MTPPDPQSHRNEIERGRLALEAERLRLERQKVAIEYRLRRVELKGTKSKSWRELLANPLALAIVGGFVTLMTSVVSNTLTSRANIQAETLKSRQAREGAQQALQADLIKKFVEGPSPSAVRENLRFLVDAGLLPDYAAPIRAYLAANPAAAPQVPLPTSTIPQNIRRPRLNALLVGISDYSPSAPSLRFPAKDAQDLAEHLRTQTAIYTALEIRMLTNNDATRARIIEELARLERDSTPVDTNIILLSGHSSRRESHGFFIPVDVSMSRIEETSVSGAEIEARLARIQGRVLVLLDSDFIGVAAVQQVPRPQAQGTALGTEAAPGSVKPQGAVVQDSPIGRERDPAGSSVLNASVLAETGVAVINAAEPGQRSLELPRLGNGVLTYAVLAGLRGAADVDSDGLIRLSELSAFVGSEVTSVTEGKQSPLVTTPSGLANVPLFAAASSRSRAGAASAQSPTQAPR